MSYSSPYINQLSQGNLQLVETAHGAFIPMMRIKKFLLNEISMTLPATAFPAFLVDGVEVDEILVSQFTYPGQAGESADHDSTLEEARTKSSAWGAGFHLLTAWEWAALMWHLKSIWGKERGPVSEDAFIENGSGTFYYRAPAKWWGIWGLTGNLYEYCDGIQLRQGKLFGPSENNISRMNQIDENDTTYWPELGSIEIHANQFLAQSPAYGDAIQKMFLNGTLLENTPRGQTFAMESNQSLVLERGGAHHSGDEAGLGCYRFTATAQLARPDAGFRVAYVPI